MCWLILTKCYFQAKQLSSSYLCYITIGTMILMTKSYWCYSIFVSLVGWASRRKFVFWPIFDWVLSPSWIAISVLSLLYHHRRGDSLTPSYPCYPSLLIWFWEPVKESSCFDNFWLSAITVLRSYLRAIFVRSLLQRWFSNSELSLYPVLLIWFWESIQESSCFDQFLTKYYLRAEELSPSYPCYITISEVIL